MNFDSANKLLDEIVIFLRLCGGYYSTCCIATLQVHILTCLASDQYLLYLGSKGIQGFVCWEYIDIDDISRVKMGQYPKYKGPCDVMHILECGVNEIPLRQIIKDLRKFGVQGVAWTNTINNRFIYYPNQKGVFYGR